MTENVSSSQTLSADRGGTFVHYVFMHSSGESCDHQQSYVRAQSCNIQSGPTLYVCQTTHEYVITYVHSPIYVHRYSSCNQNL